MKVHHICDVTAACPNVATHVYTNDVGLYLAKACDNHHAEIQSIPLEVAQLAVKADRERVHNA